MIGYKVLCEGTEKDYYSATCEGRILDYMVGITTYPEKNDGPLALFKNEGDAFEFSKGLSPHENGGWITIFKAEYTESPDNSLWYEIDHGKIYQTDSFPKGTIFASSIKLIEEIM